MTDKQPFDEFELGSMFDAARSDAPAPSGGLMARIMADAEAQIAAQAQVSVVATPKPGLLAALLAMIGGWPAATGLATATVVGLTVGLSTPESLDDLTGGYLAAATGYDMDVLMPSYGDLLVEG